MTMVSSPATNGSMGFNAINFKINKPQLLNNGYRSTPPVAGFLPRSVILDAKASSSQSSEIRTSSNNSFRDVQNFRKKDINFTHVGFLEQPATPKYVLESDERDETHKLDGSPSNDAFSSGNSTYHDSTPASSNCTPNSITNELTNIPDLKDLEEARKDVRHILFRSVDERKADPSITPTKDRLMIGPIKEYVPATPMKERNFASVEKERLSITPTTNECSSASISKERVSAPTRKRLLSDRGEQELENFPVIDIKNLKHGWNGCVFVKTPRGAGLVNHSNDCFLNVVLQSVVHTSQLARFIVENHEWNICRTKALSCFTCGLRQHVMRASCGQHSVLNTNWIRQGHIQKIFPSHRRGYQEDAHEMLTLLLAALEPPIPKQPNGLHGIQPPPRSSPIEQIFGGSLRNQIRCNTCSTVHTNYERIREMNLGLTRKIRTTVRDLLRDFFADEQLQHFLCKSCKVKRTATRSTAILRAPTVLIVQLKRFNIFGGKNRLPVDTDGTLFLGDYLYNKESLSYKLNGVIEHIGSGVNFGHYISAWRGFNDKTWFRFDDADVDEISELTARSMEPYILFYSRIGTESTPSTSQPQKRPCYSTPEHSLKKPKLFNCQTPLFM